MDNGSVRGPILFFQTLALLANDFLPRFSWIISLFLSLRRNHFCGVHQKWVWRFSSCVKDLTPWKDPEHGAVTALEACAKAPVPLPQGREKLGRSSCRCTKEEGTAVVLPARSQMSVQVPDCAPKLGCEWVRSARGGMLVSTTAPLGLEDFRIILHTL